ncbi:MAG: M1 family metallopeptidase [bacterium]
MCPLRAGGIALALVLGSCTSPGERPVADEGARCPDLGDTPGSAGLGDPVLPFLGNGGYDVSHYSLDLTVDPARNRLSAVVAMEATATQELTAFNLDFAGPPIRELTVNDRRAPFCRHEGELTIVPGNSLSEGARFAVSVSYAGSPRPVLRPGAPGPEGWIHISDEQVSAGGLWGAETSYFPANATAQDKATFLIRVTVPKPLGVAATGRLMETVDHEGSTTYVWESDVPTPSSRISFVTGRFVSEQRKGPGGLLIQNLFPPQTPKAVRGDLEMAVPIIETLSRFLGPFPFETLGFTWVPGTPAETAIGAHMRIFVLNLPGLGDRDLAHEIGHQWFGNSVTPATSQDDWLSEGFATYTESLWTEHTLGPEHRDTLPGTWLTTLGDRTRPLAEVTGPEELGDHVTYLRGAATLHALRLEVGDDTFFEILRRYAGDFRHASAKTEDFVAVAEEVIGHDMSRFFDAWLYQEAVPDIPGLGSS